MKIQNVLLVILVLLSGLLIFWNFSQIIVGYENTIDEYDQAYNECVSANAEYEEIFEDYSIEANPNLWDAGAFKVINRFADTHEYDWDNYNCVDFTQDVIYELERNGYDAKGMCGCKGDNEREDNNYLDCHAWVQICFLANGKEFCLDIEPQTGRIEDYTNEFPIAKCRERERLSKL